MEGVNMIPLFYDDDTYLQYASSIIYLNILHVYMQSSEIIIIILVSWEGVSKEG